MGSLSTFLGGVTITRLGGYASFTDPTIDRWSVYLKTSFPVERYNACGAIHLGASLVDYAIHPSDHKYLKGVLRANGSKGAWKACPPCNESVVYADMRRSLKALDRTFFKHVFPKFNSWFPDIIIIGDESGEVVMDKAAWELFMGEIYTALYIAALGWFFPDNDNCHVQLMWRVYSQLSFHVQQSIAEFLYDSTVIKIDGAAILPRHGVLGVFNLKEAVRDGLQSFDDSIFNGEPDDEDEQDDMPTSEPVHASS